MNSYAQRAIPCRIICAEADTFPLGAHLVTERWGYAHHGIYAGQGNVVHYAGFKDLLRRGPVETISLERFAEGYEIRVHAEPDSRYDGLQAVQRATSRLGEDRYRLLTNNCEHFCTWCISGESPSVQVETGLSSPTRVVLTALRLLCGMLFKRSAISKSNLGVASALTNRGLQCAQAA